MQSVTFVGLGLNDEKGMSLEGLEEARRSGAVFAEFYTNPMTGLDLSRLEALIGKKLQILDRAKLEDDSGREIIRTAQDRSVVLLVPGDPMIATTHVSLRLSLAKQGIKSRIIHAASIMSAICGATGLQSYKFGKAITIPYDDPLPQSVIDTISDNRSRGLHSLLLLDVKADRDKQLTIPQAIEKIGRARTDMNEMLAVGAARIGARDEKVKAAKMRRLIQEDFGGTPHSIVAVGKLHFMEAEALKVIGGAADTDLSESV